MLHASVLHYLMLNFFYFYLVHLYATLCDIQYIYGKVDEKEKYQKCNKMKAQNTFRYTMGTSLTSFTFLKCKESITPSQPSRFAWKSKAFMAFLRTFGFLQESCVK